MTRALLAILFAASAASAADVPFTIAHQGRLTEGNDQLVDATLRMRFAIYDVAETPSGQAPVAPLWSAEYETVVHQGLYSATLGNVASGQPALPSSLFDGSKLLWLGITIGDTGELRPRLSISSVAAAAFASRAGDSALLEGKSLADLDERFAAKADYALSTDLDDLAANLATPGTVNGAGNPVHWSKLTGVPASIQNGAITEVTASAPLSGTGTAADPLVLAPASATAPGYLAAADWTRFDAKAGANDARFTDARAPTAGSPHYLQNGTTAQAGASFNVGGTGTIGGALKVGGSLEVAGEFQVGAVPAGGENLIANPDLAMGERGWAASGGYPGFTFTRTLKTDTTAPVGTYRKMEVKVTAIGQDGDVHPISFRLSGLALNTDYNASCWVRADVGTKVKGHFNPEGHDAAWGNRQDAPNIGWSYPADGKWHRVSGTFNTGDRPNYLLVLRGFDDFGSWDITGCQVTRGKALNNFTVTHADLRCPNGTQEQYGFCIHQITGYSKTQREAAEACRDLGMRLCSTSEVGAAYAMGAEWCHWGWTGDASSSGNGVIAFPMQVFRSGCGAAGVVTNTVAVTAKYGANCCMGR